MSRLDIAIDELSGDGDTNSFSEDSWVFYLCHNCGESEKMSPIPEELPGCRSCGAYYMPAGSSEGMPSEEILLGKISPSYSRRYDGLANDVGPSE